MAETAIRFWQGMTKAQTVELLDKVLLGRNADGSTRYADINQIANLISSAVGSGIEPTAEPNTTLPAPAQAGKIMIMKPGNYTQPDGTTPLVAPANSFNVGYWDGDEWSIAVSIETEADLSGYVKQTDIVSENLFPDGTIISNQLINSNGEKQTVSGWKMIRLPVTANSIYEIGRIFLSTSYNFAFYDGSDQYIPGSLQTILTGLSASAEAPPTANRLYVNIKRPADDDSVYANGYITEGSLDVIEILGRDISAKKLLPGNFVPNPAQDVEAVNRGYFRSQGVTITDLENGISYGTNLFPGGTIINDMLINSSGNKENATGWKMIRIPVTGDNVYSIDKLFLTASYNLAFYNSSDAYIAGSMANIPTGERTTRNSPSNAFYLYVNIKRAADPDSVYEDAHIQQGAFEVASLKGFALKSAGQSYDQSLNTFDNVEFANIKVNGMEMDLPTGATEPGGLSIGDAWIDTANGNVIKVKLS